LSNRQTPALDEIPCRRSGDSYDLQVEGQPFFTTIAGLAVSLAGFGAVIAWLRDDPTGWDPVNLWRVKTIVRHALTIAFLCLALVPIHTFTGDDAMTIRIGSALFVLFELSDLWRLRDPDPVVWDPISLRVFIATSGALVLLGIVNVFVGGLGLLQALALAVLTSPAGIFFNFVREMGRPQATAQPDHGE
jgi:hypothetical protein